MGEKELRIKLSELDRVSIVCGRCKAAMTFPATLEEGTPDRSGQNSHCHSCGWSLQHVQHIVEGFRNVHRMAKDSGELEVELVIRLGPQDV
jgi:hypothetical protein